jgi:hypothetical protein
MQSMAKKYSPDAMAPRLSATEGISSWILPLWVWMVPR